VVVGDSGVGKTNLILRYVEDMFDENQMSTIGVDFQRKQVEVEGITINIQFWDTAGQEKHHSMSKSYFK
jgi:small GTP-binding protein